MKWCVLWKALYKYIWLGRLNHSQILRTQGAGRVKNLWMMGVSDFVEFCEFSFVLIIWFKRNWLSKHTVWEHNVHMPGPCHGSFLWLWNLLAGCLLSDFLRLQFSMPLPGFLRIDSVLWFKSLSVNLLMLLVVCFSILIGLKWYDLDWLDFRRTVVWGFSK